MEIGLSPELPTYSGGLGVLAGDTLRGAADMGVPLVGITLVHRKGYFHQHLDSRGEQTETPNEWAPEQTLEQTQPRVIISIEGRKVHVRAWRYLIRGVRGYEVPVLLLDTMLPENSDYDRSLSEYLYGGDERYRLCQEVVLGLGGVAMLRALDYHDIQAYHMNEGHSALLTLALLEEQTWGSGLQSAKMHQINAVRGQCVFTTHTPVSAGHDRFPMDLARRVLGDDKADLLETFSCCLDNFLNMTYLGLYFSRYINGVSMRHEEISQSLFPEYPINSITNGVHAATWASSYFSELYDRYFAEWRKDNRYLRHAVKLPLSEIRQAHARAKEDLLIEVKRRTGVAMSMDVFTIGFARRATPYKRADLIFSDIEKLRRIVHNVGPIQLIFGGKAHPHDEGGKRLIRNVVHAGHELQDAITVVYLEDYDMGLGKVLCSGVDLWLNNPQKPHEASGTSGMKAALNGVPSLSVLDGWWIEGHLEGVTGWSIGDDWDDESDPEEESRSLYDKLERIILPLFYHDPLGYARIMRSTIAANGSYFNAQRMVSQYLEHAYRK